MDARGESSLCPMLLAARGRGRGADQDSARPRQAWQPPGNAEAARLEMSRQRVVGVREWEEPMDW
jgi:hypothetical protein